MTFYKVLGEDGRVHHGGRGSWPLPKGKRPSKWVKVGGPLVPCRNGLHLCRPDDLVYWLGPVIYEAEYRGERIDHENKIVVREARLLRRVDAWNDRTARLFAVDCARRALVRERKAGREPDKRLWEALRVARRYTNGKAADDELAAAYAVAVRAAAAAAQGAAYAAAYAASDAAADAAAYAAADAAYAAAERRWQTKRLHAYLNGEL